jgi:hypothetical protein
MLVFGTQIHIVTFIFHRAGILQSVKPNIEYIYFLAVDCTHPPFWANSKMSLL